MRTLFAILAIIFGIATALTINVPGPFVFLMGAGAIGFGVLATFMSYGGDEEDYDEADRY